MKKVLFICTGNTCRSPMAEGLFRACLQKKHLGFIEVTSAGLAAAAGFPPTDEAVAAVKGFGVDISAHRARAISQYDLQAETCFICMTREHAAVLKRYVAPERVLTLDISDPYGGDIETYTRCAEQIIAQFPSVFQFVFGLDNLQDLSADHIDGVAEIEKQCFAHPWTVDALREELSNPTARFFVGLLGGKTIGYIGANNIAGEVYMTNLAVLPAYRGKGFGELLLRALLYSSERENAAFVTLEVRPSNAAAIALYQKCGFERRGERKRFYRDPEEDALILTYPIGKTE